MGAVKPSVISCFNMQNTKYIYHTVTLIHVLRVTARRQLMFPASRILTGRNQLPVRAPFLLIGENVCEIFPLFGNEPSVSP